MKEPRELHPSKGEGLSGGLGNIDEQRGHPGKGDSKPSVKKDENPIKRDNEGQEPGVEERRGQD